MIIETTEDICMIHDTNERRDFSVNDNDQSMSDSFLKQGKERKKKQ